MTRSVHSSLFPIMVGACVVICISFAVRSTFGLFQIPIATEFGWDRAPFSTAIAIQSLAWGFGQPLFGALAERYGDRFAIVLGAVLYAVGLFLSALAVTPAQHWALEVVVGMGVAGTGFGVILGVVGRAAPDEKRSMALAIATAAGSAGQVIGPPVAEWLLSLMPWQSVFVVFGLAVLASLLALPLLKSPEDAARRAAVEQTLSDALRRAFRDPSYTLIFLGFFSCGYQLGFITAHFPAMVTEMCGPINPSGLLARMGVGTTSALGAAAISVIGLANIAGTLIAGWLGGRYVRKYLLAGIYVSRAVASALFILLPITPLTVIAYAVVMGALWLATVPLTSGLVAYIYGLRYMGTLYGFVFLSHQLGMFLGIWLGGRMYDATGSYTAVWWVGVGVGAFSALVHLPIREAPLTARAAMPAAA